MSAYKSIPREFNTLSGVATTLPLSDVERWARKAIVKVTGSSGPVNFGTLTDAVLGIQLSPGDEYVFEPSAGFRFDLREILTQSEDEFTAIGIHVLYWGV